MRLLLLIFFCCPLLSPLFSPEAAHGQFADSRDRDSEWGYGGSFVKPNELYPQKSIRILEQAPEGAYIAVGTERGFIGAAYSPNSTHLILMDIDNKVVIYNKVNTLLLKMAKDRGDYLRLRFGGGIFSKPILTSMFQVAKLSHQKWNDFETEFFPGDAKLNAIDAAFTQVFPARDELALKDEARAAGLSREEVEYLGRHIKEWDDHVGRSLNFWKFQRKPIPFIGKFAGANYLYDDIAFEKLSLMAKANRIIVKAASITNTKFIGEMVDYLKANKIGLSVFDISNAWWWRWNSTEGIAKGISAINELASNNSLLLLTQRNSLLMWPAQILVERTLRPIIYRAYTFGRIRSFSDTEAFVKFLWPQNAIPALRSQIDPLSSWLGAKCSIWLSSRAN